VRKRERERKIGRERERERCKGITVRATKEIPELPH
jgi:hypothetical protein